MTHYYQYTTSLPRTRRKLNARFVHQLKKLCGKCFYLHVSEVFADEEMGDMVFIKVDRTATEIKEMILSLCSRYGIGNDYIEVIENIEDETKEYINIYLSQKKPFA
jgi:hypothetical protein